MLSLVSYNNKKTTWAKLTETKEIAAMGFRVTAMNKIAQSIITCAF